MHKNNTMTDAFNPRILSDIFNKSPDECAVIMEQLIAELGTQKIPLPQPLAPYRKWLLDVTKQAMNACASPIEKAFAGGLLMGFLFRADKTLLVSEAEIDAPAYSEFIRQHIKNRKRLENDWEMYKEDYAEGLRNCPPQHRDDLRQKEPMLDTFLAYAASLIPKKQLSQADFDVMFENPIVSLGYLGWSAFILSPQAIFPKCGSDGKDARVDIYIWCPAQPKFNMIVECDGYEWHNSKEMFTSDRQRDRNFHRMNFVVYRFSGSELFHDMYGVADEAWKSAVFHRFDDKTDINLYGLHSAK